MRLMVDPDAGQVAHHTPVPVPLHWQDQVKAGLDQDFALGVIEPVPVGKPLTWCHSMVVCAKRWQALTHSRLPSTERPRCPGNPPHPKPFPPSTLHTKWHKWQKPCLTAGMAGYYSIPLHEHDWHLTTFITPWGRYRYKTAPQGYIASGDGCSRRFDELVSHIHNKTKCIDDTLL